MISLQLNILIRHDFKCQSLSFKPNLIVPFPVPLIFVPLFIICVNDLLIVKKIDVENHSEIIILPRKYDCSKNVSLDILFTFWSGICLRNLIKEFWIKKSSGMNFCSKTCCLQGQVHCAHQNVELFDCTDCQVSFRSLQGLVKFHILILLFVCIAKIFWKLQIRIILLSYIGFLHAVCLREVVNIIRMKDSFAVFHFKIIWVTVQVIPQTLFCDDLWRLCIRCVVQPSSVGFNMGDIEIITKLPQEVCVLMWRTVYRTSNRFLICIKLA